MQSSEASATTCTLHEDEVLGRGMLLQVPSAVKAELEDPKVARSKPCKAHKLATSLRQSQDMDRPRLWEQP